MEAKAFQCMQRGMNVLFVLPETRHNTKTLLTMRMQQRWKDLKEEYQWQNDIHICSLKRYKGLDFRYLKELVQSETFRDAAIFADELEIGSNDDIQTLKDIGTMYEQSTIWFAITYIDSYGKITTEQVKSEFIRHNFYIPELVNPIRNSKEIVKHSYPEISGEQII